MQERKTESSSRPKDFLLCDKLEIPLSLVTALVAEQFPQWSHLSIKPVELSGWDNRTFRLGEGMCIRLPSAAEYVPQVEKEQK